MEFEKEIIQLRGRIERLENKISEIDLVLASGSANKDNRVANKIPEFGNFVAKIQPKNHEERALTIGFYLDKYESKHLSKSLILEYNKRIGWPNYTNYVVLFKALKSKGLIEEMKGDNGEPTYKLLDSGITLISEKLTGE